MNKYEANNQYVKENYFKVTFRIPKTHRDVLQELAEEYETSVNKLIINAIEKTYGIKLSRGSK